MHAQFINGGKHPAISSITSTGQHTEFLKTFKEMKPKKEKKPLRHINDDTGSD